MMDDADDDALSPSAGADGCAGGGGGDAAAAAAEVENQARRDEPCWRGIPIVSDDDSDEMENAGTHL
jgi:hypothetical protein